MSDLTYIKAITKKGLLSYTLSIPKIWLLIMLSTLHHIITVSVPFFLIFMMSQLWYINDPITYIQLGFGFIIIGSLWMLTSFIKDRIFYNLLLNYSTGISTETIELLNQLPYSQIGNLPIESQLSRFSPLDNLSYSWLNNIVKPILDLPLIIISFSIICLILGFTYFSFITVILLSVIFINKYKSKLTVNKDDKISESVFSGTLNDIINNLALIHSHNKKQFFEQKCNDLIENKCINNYILNTKKAILSNISESITLLLYIGALIFAVIYTLNDYIDIKFLIAILLLTWFSIAPLKTILSALDEIPKANEVVRQFKSLLKANQSIQRHKKQQLDESFQGNIIFNNVSFSYGNGSKFMINNINLSIKRGELLVINGPSGSGKSTILKLMSGLIDKSAGMILIDHEIDHIDPNSLNDKILLISNDSYFDTESIKDNLKINLDNKTCDELQTTVKQLNISADINCNTINKYKVGEFSAIDSNKISYHEIINKIILSKLSDNITGKIILLDEPIVNEKDNEFEYLANILSKLKSKNTIVIASRYNFYSPLADKVIMLNNGTIYKQWETS